MLRGELWWASLGVPAASEPGYRRPVLVVQSDLFNQSAIRTVTVNTLEVAFADLDVASYQAEDFAGFHVVLRDGAQYAPEETGYDFRSISAYTPF